ncbi:MAG TPA: SHOCT domain-containing protein [Actinocrinis sp.]|nr:SHOCT domain-containing protein [Actinocrinis sp.]
MSYNYPLLDAFLTMLWFFLWILWIFLVVRVVLDIFRDDALSGWGKAGWLVFVLILPFVGVLVYLIARGATMGAREQAEARRNKKEFDDYIRETATSSDSAAATGAAASPTDQLARLAQLKADGTITEEEFQQAKAKILA